MRFISNALFVDSFSLFFYPFLTCRYPDTTALSYTKKSDGLIVKGQIDVNAKKKKKNTYFLL